MNQRHEISQNECIQRHFRLIVNTSPLQYASLILRIQNNHVYFFYKEYNSNVVTVWSRL